MAWKSTLPCLHFKIHNSNYTTEAPCRVQSYSFAHSLVVSCCNKIQELYWVEPPSHGQWTLMNPQILRRVEDPCRTQQHMRRGIQFLGIGKRKALPQFIKGKALLPLHSPTATEPKRSLGEGHAQATPATSWEQAYGPNRPPPVSARFYQLYREYSAMDVEGGTRCCISPAVFAHVLERSCRPPGMTALALPLPCPR